MDESQSLPNDLLEDPNGITLDKTYIHGKPVEWEYVIAVRPHLPGGIRRKLTQYSSLDPDNVLAKPYEWQYNNSEVITEETASTLAKPNHGVCNGKGVLEWSRVRNKNMYVDIKQICDCALKNANKILSQ